MRRSSVSLSLFAQGGPERQLVVIREKPDLVAQSIDYGRVDRTQIVKILQFEDGTNAEFRKIVKANISGATRLILDLRDNGGGSLIDAIGIADLFISHGTIATLIGNSQKNSEVYKAEMIESENLDIPMIVIVNKNTAAGAELLAATLQDNRRALIIGDRTRGSATIRRILPVGYIGVVSFATKRIGRPGGSVIEGEGVEPDCSWVANEDARAAAIVLSAEAAASQCERISSASLSVPATQ